MTDPILELRLVMGCMALFVIVVLLWAMRAPKPETERHTCLSWVLRQRRMHGGYILVRRSRRGWWPHFGWVQEAPKESLWWEPKEGRKRLLPPVFPFEGSVHEGDTK